MSFEPLAELGLDRLDRFIRQRLAIRSTSTVRDVVRPYLIMRIDLVSEDELQALDVFMNIDRIRRENLSSIIVSNTVS